MDTYGKIALVVFLIAFFAVAYGYRYMSNRAPKWAVLATATVIFALSFTVEVGHSREMAGVAALLRITSLFGITYGISVIRRKKG